MAEFSTPAPPPDGAPVDLSDLPIEEQVAALREMANEKTRELDQLQQRIRDTNILDIQRRHHAGEELSMDEKIALSNFVCRKNSRI